MILPADLRLRLVAAFAALAMLSPVLRPGPAAAALALVLLLYLAARQPIPWRRLIHLEGFLVLLLLSLPFTVPGTPVLQLGPLGLSAEGLLRVVTLGCKVAASVLLISLMVAGTEPLQLAGALQSLRVPGTLVRLFVTTSRYLGVIRGEFRSLTDAMRLRSFRARSDRHSWRSYGYLFGMLLVRALDRAERVEEAMRLRGYAGRFPQTDPKGIPWADWIAGTTVVAAAALLLGWDRL